MSPAPAHDPPAPGAPGPSRRGWLPAGAGWASVLAVAGLVGLSGLRAAGGPWPGLGGLTDLFFMSQDVWPAVAGAAFVLALTALPARWAPTARTPGGRGAGTAFGAAALLGVIAWAGARVVFADHTLSADETMARFDATVFAHGRLLAPVPPAWRAFVPAMQPSFLLPVEGSAAWGSSYLPVSAAIQAAFLRLGSVDAASAGLAALSVALAWGCARRLAPDRPDAAWAAALLLASAPQVAVTAMTPYAMTAHLAFDLLWLWLVLHPSWRSQALAGAVAFAACGLHQLVFAPLFAAPFVAALWWERRWARAALQTAAFALAGLFWTRWFALEARLSGVTLAPGSGSAVDTLLQLLRDFTPRGALLMAENLVRFVSWQDVLLLPLWLLGVRDAFRRGAGWTERALAAVPVVVAAAMLVLLPYQGHGWGYRYLHGAEGPACLTAALAWSRRRARADAPGRTALTAGLVAGVAASALLLLPLRAWQAWRWTAPYAAAERELRRQDADVVLVDASGLLFGWDLVRNDPFLRARPRIMGMEFLAPQDLDALCARGSVAVFDAADGRRLGIRTAQPNAALLAAHLRNRARLAELGCGRPVTP